MLLLGEAHCQSARIRFCLFPSIDSLCFAFSLLLLLAPFVFRCRRRGRRRGEPAKKAAASSSRTRRLDSCCYEFHENQSVSPSSSCSCGGNLFSLPPVLWQLVCLTIGSHGFLINYCTRGNQMHGNKQTNCSEQTHSFGRKSQRIFYFNFNHQKEEADGTKSLFFFFRWAKNKSRRKIFSFAPHVR